jgi:putative endonuclease
MVRASPDGPARGRAGEDAAAEFLRKAGWTLLARNVLVRGGELDLVVERRGVIGIVEVKARSRDAVISPGEAVDPAKADRVRRAAEMWLSRHGAANLPVRYLLAAVELDDDGRPAAVRIDSL